MVFALEVNRNAHPARLWRSWLSNAGLLRWGDLSSLAGCGRAELIAEILRG
jgi:hypothetical protein